VRVSEKISAAAVLAAMAGLGPGGDAGPMRTLVQAQPAACLEAVGELPGVDQLRAGLLRALPAVVGDTDERRAWWEAADAAIAAYEPEALDPADQLRRHPSWVGLCVLELAEQRGEPIEQALGRAVALARRGFRALPGRVASGDGEVLWALAESAGEVGWWDWSHRLLDAARGAEFAEPELRDKVELLVVLSRLEAGDEAVDEALDALIAAEPTDEQTFVHALWIGAQRDREAGRLERARARLALALTELGEDSPPEVGERISAALAELG
jgi:hypothetical protein